MVDLFAHDASYAQSSLVPELRRYPLLLFRLRLFQSIYIQAPDCQSHTSAHIAPIDSAPARLGCQQAGQGCSKVIVLNVRQHLTSVARGKLPTQGYRLDSQP